MSDETITPALTAEEWGAADQEAQRYSEDQSLADAWEVMIGNRRFPSGRKGLHQQAALCLYGQPFGFDRRDVRVLRDLQRSVRVFRSVNGGPEYDAVEHLAARIAALLPPEDGK